MARAVHYRVGTETKTSTMPTACNNAGFSTTDTDNVTCPWCLDTELYQRNRTQYRDVVTALAYPKEDHPCLRLSTSPKGT